MGHLLFLEDRGSPQWRRKSKWFNSSAQSIRYLDEDEGQARQTRMEIAGEKIMRHQYNLLDNRSINPRVARKRYNKSQLA